MELTFTITDYTFNPAGEETVIEEPMGWDMISFHLQRDVKWRGFFDFIDDTVGSLQFINDAYVILKEAYELNGAESNVTLEVDFQCDPSGNRLSLYSGSFDFTSYKNFTGDTCMIEISVESNTDMMQFRNRYGSKVDLDSLISADAEPTEQSITAPAVFTAGTNVIRFEALLNGLKPGSIIVISGTASNNGTFNVASALPDYTTVIEGGVVGTPTLQTIIVSATFNEETDTITINYPLSGLTIGSTVTITGTLFNNHVYTVTSVTPYFNYTVIGLSGFAVVNESYAATSFNSTFYTNNLPTATLITVAQTLVNEDDDTTTITASLISNDLLPYTGINKLITIPGKIVRMTSRWQTPIDYISPDFALFDGTVAPYSAEQKITPAFSDILAEIDETDIAEGDWNVIDKGIRPIGGAPDTIVFWRQASLPCSGDGNFTYDISGSLLSHADIPANDRYTVSNFRFVVVRGVAWNTTGGGGPINPLVLTDIITPSAAPDRDFHISGSVDVSDFHPGEYLWVYFILGVDSFTAPYDYPDLKINANSFWQFYIDSECAGTASSVYLINESLSRTSESVTNGNLQIYSDYFGRVNAEPVASEETGCGGLECITNGLKIRGAIMPTGSQLPKMTVSFQDLFEAMDSIHNIAMALEDDPNRVGFKRLRIEPFNYFFNDTILLTCDAVKEYTREVDEKLITSNFKVGYTQKETWNNNGLYDIFGIREYRTSLKQTSNDIDKTCRFMASDYTIEFTRRQYGQTSKDWRYDSNIFVLCLIDGYHGDATFTHSGMNNYITLNKIVPIKIGDVLTVTGTDFNNGTHTVTSVTYPFGNTLLAVTETVVNEFSSTVSIVDTTNGVYTIEQGMPNGTNILYPDTMYNYRISPAHNAMRHFKNIAMSYRDPTTGTMLFTSGDGNFYSLGQLLDACALENQMLSEGNDITETMFTEVSEARPKYFPEKVSFEFPLSYDDFLTIFANPYGLVGYSYGNQDIQYGWIEDLKYIPADGKGQFILRPKIEYGGYD